MGYLLRIVGGEEDGKVIEIPRDRSITLGRGPQNDVQLPDRKLSRTHCQVAFRNGKCIATDLNSTNGTYVSGERIEEKVLAPGDVLTIGTTRLKAAYREEAPAQATCERCGRILTGPELKAAEGAEGRLYCAKCRAEMGPAEQEEAVTEQPGKHLGDYVLDRKMRETLYGTQFKASHRNLGEPVLLNLLRTRDAELAEKVLHACYKTGNLIHPSILLLFETGEDEGRFFFSTEYVGGPTLAEHLEQHQAMAHREAFRAIDQLAHAIASAAEKHHSHGTLAPCNVYLTGEQGCKVGEFGLGEVARYLSPEAAPFPLPLMAYRAPEQLRGRVTSTFETDLYALGAIFYHLVTGSPPYTGQTTEEVRAQVLEGAYRPIGEAAPDLAEDTSRIIERCMASAPSGRYQTAREMLYDFEQAARM